MDELTSLLIDPPHERKIFTNRTLNMRTIRALGYDMDYTLINYDVKRWERAMKQASLNGHGAPVRQRERTRYRSANSENAFQKVVGILSIMVCNTKQDRSPSSHFAMSSIPWR